MKYAFNGYLFSQRQTGVMRYAKEILLGIDKICRDNEFVLVVPEYADKIPDLKRIKIVHHGKTRGNMWEQIDFLSYLKKTDVDSVNFNNTMPLFQPGIIVIHDIAYKIHPEFGTSLHGKISNAYHRAIFSSISKNVKPIVTVSYFSKYQLIDEYKIDPKRIYVISNAWQHMDRCGYDESIINQHGLNKGEFFFSLGSLSAMKNTKWIIEVAKKNPAYQFVLAGAQALNSRENFIMPKNVTAVGFITDEQIKALIKECKAFIYPSIYDGFGIPPLEALSQGVKVICSNAACLPEIYGSSVIYIDPYDSNVNIEELIKQHVEDPRGVLEKYSWDKSAAEFYELLQRNGI